MNKQSNSYTILYIICLVVVVGAGLAFTSMSLKGRQQQNADADKMYQILAAAHITPDKSDVIASFNQHIVEQLVVNSEGQVIGKDAFAINVEEQSKIADSAERMLPVYKCATADGDKYILPVYGAGLWGPIWGYIALDSDGNTVYGAYFAHQGETPGLGAEIEKPAFCGQFNENLHMFTADDKFLPIEVVKAGQTPQSGADYVDGVSGGTITSMGVGAMINNCISPYQAFLRTLKN